MHEQHHRWGLKTKVQQRHENNRELAKNQDDDYGGKTAEYGYSQVIFDLLKDPVSLGLLGANNNRGRQR